MPINFLNVLADVYMCAGKDNIPPHEQALYSWWQENDLASLVTAQLDYTYNYILCSVAITIF